MAEVDKSTKIRIFNDVECTECGDIVAYAQPDITNLLAANNADILCEQCKDVEISGVEGLEDDELTAEELEEDEKGKEQGGESGA